MEGKIIEQGTYSSLSNPAQYAQNLAGAQHKLESNIEKYDASDKSQTSKSKVPAVVSTLDEGRSAGDWTVYKYYIKALGWPSLLIFAGLVSSEQGFTTLQSIFHIHSEISFY